MMNLTWREVMKGLGFVITLCSVLTTVLLYIGNLKEANYQLKLQYMKDENIILKDTISQVSIRLDEIYKVINNNDSTIKLLVNRVDRLEEDQKELEQKVFRK